MIASLAALSYIPHRLSRRTLQRVCLRLEYKKVRRILRIDPHRFHRCFRALLPVRQRPDEINPTLVHLDDRFPVRKPSVGHHLLRLPSQVLLNLIHGGVQTMGIVALLAQMHSYNRACRGIRAYLHVIARYDGIVAMFHLPSFRLRYTHTRLLPVFFALPGMRPAELISRLDEPFLALPLRSFPRFVPL